MTGTHYLHLYCADEADFSKGVLNLSCPVKSGVVQDWDAFERILYHTFDSSLRVAPEELLGVAITEPPNVSLG